MILAGSGPLAASPAYNLLLLCCICQQSDTFNLQLKTCFHNYEKVQALRGCLSRRRRQGRPLRESNLRLAGVNRELNYYYFTFSRKYKSKLNTITVKFIFIKFS